MTFGDALKRLREDAGLSQYRLAKESGVSQSFISQIETGERGTPSPETLERLAKPLKVPYEQLLTAAGYLKKTDTPVSTNKDTSLPTWLSNLPPEMQEFVKEESKHGWPYLRLARGLKMQDLSPAELQAIIETWMDAKKRYEKEFGPRPNDRRE